MKNGSYTKMFKGDSRNQKIIMTIAIVINVFVFICLGVINPEYKATTSHHYQYYRLAEAILDGHFYLNDTPPASLIMLDNPYDPDMREERAVKYKNTRHRHANHITTSATGPSGFTTSFSALR